MAISKIDPLTTPAAAKRNGLAREVSEVVSVVKAMDPKYGAMFWSMCITGMGNAEYFDTPWEVLPDRVRIHGNKRPWRNRFIPLIQANIQRPTSTVKYLGQALREAAPEGWQLYDARRSFAHWCEMAQVARPRISAYMGHKTKTMTELYLRHNVTPYLNADAEKLREYIVEHKDAPTAPSAPPAPWSVL